MTMASPSLLVALTSVLLFLSALPALGLKIPILSTLASPNTGLGAIRHGCNSFTGWIGSGVSRNDCELAIEELWKSDVQPRRGQEYEFYARGAPRLDFPLPLVLTPRKHEYGEFHEGNGFWRLDSVERDQVLVSSALSCWMRLTLRYCRAIHQLPVLQNQMLRGLMMFTGRR